MEETEWMSARCAYPGQSGRKEEVNKGQNEIRKRQAEKTEILGAPGPLPRSHGGRMGEDGGTQENLLCNKAKGRSHRSYCRRRVVGLATIICVTLALFLTFRSLGRGSAGVGVALGVGAGVSAGSKSLWLLCFGLLLVLCGGWACRERE